MVLQRKHRGRISDENIDERISDMPHGIILSITQGSSYVQHLWIFIQSGMLMN